MKSKVIFFAILFLFLIYIPVRASNVKKVSETVFLFDSSVSMGETEISKRVKSLINDILYAIPAEIKIGYVSYNTDVIDVKEISEDRDSIREKLEASSYFGYSNAGAGLKRAVDLLPQGGKIFWFCDGEIDMKSSGEIETSKNKFNEALLKAKELGIEINICSFEKEKSEALLYSASSETKGFLLFSSEYTNTQMQEEILKSLTYEVKLKVKASYNENDRKLLIEAKLLDDENENENVLSDIENDYSDWKFNISGKEYKAEYLNGELRTEIEIDHADEVYSINLVPPENKKSLYNIKDNEKNISLIPYNNEKSETEKEVQEKKEVSKEKYYSSKVIFYIVLITLILISIIIFIIYKKNGKKLEKKINPKSGVDKNRILIEDKNVDNLGKLKIYVIKEKENLYTPITFLLSGIDIKSGISFFEILEAKSDIKGKNERFVSAAKGIIFTVSENKELVISNKGSADIFIDDEKVTDRKFNIALKAKFSVLLCGNSYEYDIHYIF